ncbi:MAG TPA: TA system VapC family ribonuclease toxin [Bryobacteraceae bacterium]|nr:TA system VapC family ribonuclease toxin [Bryobacteraceae bacterium]
MTYLADVNVWIALTNPGHQHRSSAAEWFSASAPDLIAFCRTTQKGLLRLLTNRHVMGANVLNAEDAWDVYDDFFKTGRVRFAEEPPGIERAWREATRGPHTGPNFWTDAYLAAFAIAAGYTVVTFDRGFKRHTAVRLRLLG